MQPIRVLIADDDRCIRRTLRMLLRIERDMEIVGEAADGMEATVLADELKPDVVLMDVEMPGMNGIEATRSIKQRDPAARIVVLSVYDSMRPEACKAGADCFLLKDCGRVKLAETIRMTSRPKVLVQTDSAG
jgi:NarL family two-component system response regulator LiaR